MTDRPPTPARRARRTAPPLDEAALRGLALAYVARFATTAARLGSYLARKLAERGWAGAGEGETALAAVVRECVAAGYVDDESYARMRGESLLKRGYGGRRVAQALAAAGVERAIAQHHAPPPRAARAAALRLAERRRFGPFGAALPDRGMREKQLAAMLRAGHALDDARRLVEARSVEEARGWAGEPEEGEEE